MSDLSPAAIAATLAELGDGAPRRIEVAEVTASTSADAKRAASQGAPAGSAFLAETQTAGRGRGAHRWHSPAGENIYLSVIARPALPAASIAPITLAVGAALAEVLADAIGDRAKVTLKWPNDVLAGGRKLAGVLVEGQLRGTEVGSVIVGVGVNVNTLDFPPEIAERATSLARLGVPSRDRARLAARLIAGIDAAIARFEQGRLASFLAGITARDALLGAAVEAEGVRGTGAGIDADGRLLVRREDGAIVAVVSGEVLAADR